MTAASIRSLEPGPRLGLATTALALLLRQARLELAIRTAAEARETLEVAVCLFPLSPGLHRGLATVAEREGRAVWAEGARALAAHLERTLGAEGEECDAR